MDSIDGSQLLGIPLHSASQPPLRLHKCSSVNVAASRQVNIGHSVVCLVEQDIVLSLVAR